MYKLIENNNGKEQKWSLRNEAEVVLKIEDIAKKYRLNPINREDLKKLDRIVSIVEGNVTNSPSWYL